MKIEIEMHYLSDRRPEWSTQVVVTYMAGGSDVIEYYNGSFHHRNYEIADNAIEAWGYWPLIKLTKVEIALPVDGKA